MSHTMQAAVLTHYKQIEPKTVPLPQISKDEVLVKIGYAGICGSDQHVYRGEFDPRTHTPMIQGHEFAGTIVEIGPDVKAFNVGERVAVDPLIWCGECPACQIGHFPACRTLKLLGIDVDGGFAEYVAAREHMLFRLPDNITDRDGALVEVFSIGFHANHRAGTQAGDTIAIWGAGRVGHVIMQAARSITDQPIYMVDVLPKRLQMAKNAVPNIIPINARECDPVQTILDATDGRGVDIAFEAVGHADAVEHVPHPVRCCAQVIRGAGVVCPLGLADDPAPLNMKELIWKEAKLITSRVSHGEFADAIQAMSAGKLNTDAFVSAEYALQDTQEAFEILEAEPEAFLKIVIRV